MRRSSCHTCGQDVPWCPVCNSPKFHDPLMHWAPDDKFAACGKPVGAQYSAERPHYVINPGCIIEVTCPQCKKAQEEALNQ